MLDIRMIRETPEIVRKDIEKRHDPEKLKLLESAIKLDKAYRQDLKAMEELRHKKNTFSKEIPGLKNKQEKIKEMKSVSSAVEKLEKKVLQNKEKIRLCLMNLPNILHESVPFGVSEKDNVEIRVAGKKPHFSFKPKDHLDILERLDLVDAERAAKVAGRGFFYLKDELVVLDYAILRFAMDFLKKKGFTVVEPPFMLRRKPYEGVTSLEDFGNVMYKVEGEDLYMIATSEHALASMFMDEVLNKKDLPLKLCGISPCFRKEIGAHGKYTRGLFRMHQFNKIEQFVFCMPEDSWKLHEELQKNSEELYKELGLHYRVVNVCTGDIGSIASKKYDTEVWMSDNTFREIGSNSNCTDYQARRLNIRYREAENSPVAGFVHTLNNTALATSRTMIAIIEQNQQEDGSVRIPEALHKYTGFKSLQANSKEKPERAKS